MRRLVIALVIALTAALLSVLGCSAEPPAPTTPPQSGDVAPEPSGSDFYAQVTGSGYRDWTPAPGYEQQQPARGPHGDTVQVFMNDVASAAVDGGVAEWPEGTLIVKDIYKAGSLSELAAMEKRSGAWYWAEWRADGQAVVEGEAAEPCQGCHASGTDGTLAISLGK